MRVAVTGGTGFLGTAACETLRSRGHDAIPFGRADGDLTTPAGTARLLASAPDAVVHCAAVCGGIGANRASPYRYAAANLAMALHVVQACVEARTKLVAVGTVCAYPKHCRVPFREDDLYAGYPEETNAPYGCAKRALLELVQAAHRQHGLRAAYVIPTNLYGPRDNFNLETSHVIPAMIRRFSSPGPVMLWGTGSASREFLHVTDAARGVALAVERVDEPHPINLGGGGEITIRDLAGLVASKCGYTGRIEWDASQPDGQPRRSVDASRAKHTLGWTPAVPLEVGIADTVAWYRRCA